MIIGTLTSQSYLDNPIYDSYQSVRLYSFVPTICFELCPRVDTSSDIIYDQTTSSQESVKGTARVCHANRFKLSSPTLPSTPS